MQTLKIKTRKKTKKERFPLYPISAWGVEKYDIPLYINGLGPLLSEVISLDVEDDEQGNFVGLGMCDGSVCHYWSDFKLVKLMNIPKFVAHNGISDIRKLQKWGFSVDESWLLWDTQLMAHILDSSRRQYGLKTLAVSDLEIVYPSYDDLTGKRSSKVHTTLDKLPLELVANYNAMDCYATYKLYEKQKEGLY